jgi:hypothetical protein
MMFIDGAPDFSPNIRDWEQWLTHLRTDPKYDAVRDDESFKHEIERALSMISELRYWALEEQTRPDWVNDLMSENHGKNL